MSSTNNKHHHSIKHTANFSLLLQIITGIVNLYVLYLPTSPHYLVLKQLLFLEFIVQFVEGSFYVWLAVAFHTINNITPYRYYDWYITTPTMLISFSIYLIYLTTLKDDHLESFDKIKEKDNFFTLVKQNSTVLTIIIVLNLIMLTFGLLNEYHVLNKYIAVFLGFIPFTIMFYLIYDNYAKYTDTGTTLFIYFSSIWAIYGIAALFPYHLKNIFYNILDLFSKNFFGLYLAYVLATSIN
jgi:hypothetical protein